VEIIKVVFLKSQPNLVLAALPKLGLKSFQDKGSGSGTCNRLPRDWWVESCYYTCLEQYCELAIDFPGIGGLKDGNWCRWRYMRPSLAIDFPGIGGLKIEAMKI
jgi:hypothetical protein